MCSIFALIPAIGGTADSMFHDHAIVGEAPWFAPGVNPALFIVVFFAVCTQNMVMLPESNLKIKMILTSLAFAKNWYKKFATNSNYQTI